MCWAKTQSRAEANPREIMGWNEYTFRMKTDVILHKARKKFALSLSLFFPSQSSSRLAPGQRVREGEARFLSLLDNRSRREKKLESCWVTGDLEERSSQCWAGEGNPWVSHFIRWLEDKWHGRGRHTGGAAETLPHSYAELLEAETHILPLSCINSPRLVSSQAGNFFPAVWKILCLHSSVTAVIGA